MGRWLAGFALLASLLAAPPAGAEWLRLDLEAELQLDRALRAGGDPVFASESSIAVAARGPLGIALAGEFRLEPDDAGRGLASGIEELTLAARLGPLAVRAGRLTADIGLAWREAPGVFGADFAEDFERSRRSGLVASLDAPGLERFGRSRLSLSWYAGEDASTPDSFALALDAHDGLGVPGLRLHAAYLNENRGGTTERGVLLALTGVWRAFPSIELEPLIEAARRTETDGPSGGVWNVTTGLTVRRGSLAISLAHSLRFPGDGPGPADRLLDATVGLGLPGGLELAVAFGDFREGGVRSRVVGLRLGWSFGFSR